MSRLLVALVRLWQALPFRRFSHCRFVPTCSDYAIEAISVHGAARGGALALWRVLRCQPFAKSGHDPVPAPHSENIP